MIELEDRLREAWQTVTERFRRGYVPSEHTLQAVFFAEITRRLPNLTAICEPVIALDQMPSVKPDIVLIDDLVVVAFIELKMSLLGCPAWENDLQKLAALCALSNRGPSVDVFVVPITGKFDHERKLVVSPHCLAVFAAIANRDCWAVSPDLPHDNIPCEQWLHLSASPEVSVTEQPRNQSHAASKKKLVG